MTPLILIPARYAATRLPGKPLADIAGKPMIAHVLARARASGVGHVVVATDTPEIKIAIEAAGGAAVMTREDHPSGSDRIYEALQKVDPKGVHDVIINLQGDMPTLDPVVIKRVLEPLADPEVDIATLAARICDPSEEHDPAVVKAWLNPVNFTRTLPPGGAPYYHHIGIYAYRRAALECFVKLPPSPREKAEKLEQLRALENGMRIDIAVVDTVPLGVDTPETLEKARSYYAAQKS
jgi:3-deoxy-manno-octulosonate cytidylyltransferase (CMP-KDO synthetase)